MHEKQEDKTMNLQFGDIQETALIPLAIKASETARPNARIPILKALREWTTGIWRCSILNGWRRNCAACERLETRLHFVLRGTKP